MEQHRWRTLTASVATILLGLVFFVSGTGKVFINLPEETEYIDQLIPAFFITPTTAYFIGYGLPWIELALGILLLIGFGPRLLSALSIPLVLAFIANNVWMISRGMEEFPQCAQCFGRWEELLGAMTPVQSLSIDVVLIALTLVVIFLYPGSFFSSRPWLANLGKKKQNQPNNQQVRKETD